MPAGLLTSEALAPREFTVHPRFSYLEVSLAAEEQGWKCWQDPARGLVVRVPPGKGHPRLEGLLRDGTDPDLYAGR